MRETNLLGLIDTTNKKIKLKKDENKLLIASWYACSIILVLLAVFFLLFSINSNKRLKKLENEKYLKKMLIKLDDIKIRLGKKDLKKKNEKHNLHLKYFGNKKWRKILKIMKENLEKIIELQNQIKDFKIDVKFEDTNNEDEIVNKIKQINIKFNTFESKFSIIKTYNKNIKVFKSEYIKFLLNITTIFKFLDKFIERHDKDIDNYFDSHDMINLIQSFNDFFNYIIKKNITEYIKFKFYRFDRDSIIFEQKNDIYYRSLIFPKRLIINDSKWFLCFINLSLNSSEKIKFTIKIKNDDKILWKLDKKFQKLNENLIISESIFFEVNKNDNKDKELKLDLIIEKYKNFSNSIIIKNQEFKCVAYNEFKDFIENKFSIIKNKLN